jgi:hypothetical protein
LQLDSSRSTVKDACLGCLCEKCWAALSGRCLGHSVISLRSIVCGAHYTPQALAVTWYLPTVGRALHSCQLLSLHRFNLMQVARQGPRQQNVFPLPKSVHLHCSRTWCKTPRILPNRNDTTAGCLVGRRSTRERHADLAGN